VRTGSSARHAAPGGRDVRLCGVTGLMGEPAEVDVCISQLRVELESVAIRQARTSRSFLRSRHRARSNQASGLCVTRRVAVAVCGARPVHRNHHTGGACQIINREAKHYCRLSGRHVVRPSCTTTCCPSHRYGRRTAAVGRQLRAQRGERVADATGGNLSGQQPLGGAQANQILEAELQARALPAGRHSPVRTTDRTRAGKRRESAPHRWYETPAAVVQPAASAGRSAYLAHTRPPPPIATSLLRPAGNQRRTVQEDSAGHHAGTDGVTYARSSRRASTCRAFATAGVDLKELPLLGLRSVCAAGGGFLHPRRLARRRCHGRGRRCGTGPLLGCQTCLQRLHEVDDLPRGACVGATVTSWPATFCSISSSRRLRYSSSYSEARTYPTPTAE